MKRRLETGFSFSYRLTSSALLLAWIFSVNFASAHPDSTAVAQPQSLHDRIIRVSTHEGHRIQGPITEVGQESFAVFDQWTSTTRSIGWAEISSAESSRLGRSAPLLTTLALAGAGSLIGLSLDSDATPAFAATGAILGWGMGSLLGQDWKPIHLSHSTLADQVLASNASGQKPVCFRGAPQEECRSFLITEAGFHQRLSSRGNREFLRFDLGPMFNVNGRLGLGATAFYKVEDLNGDGRYGGNLRTRHWLSNEVGLEVSPGVAWDHIRKKMAFSGDITVNYHDQFAFVLSYESFAFNGGWSLGLQTGSDLSLVSGLAYFCLYLFANNFQPYG